MPRHSSRITLSQSALKNNIGFLRRKIGPGSRISSVIKANAYGHGIPQMVRMLERCGIEHLSVASAYEASLALKAASDSTSIMIMGILYDEDIPWAIENGIEFYVFDYDRLKVVLSAAQKVGRPAIIHIEVETGTNRTGMNHHDFVKAITFLKRNREHIVFEGVCTHLGGAESIANEFKIRPQIDLFYSYLKELRSKKLKPNYRHMACSASALAYPETRLDMCRIGVSTYGFWPSPDVYHKHLLEIGKTSDSPLRRVIAWKTDVMDVKQIKAGEFIGYGTAYQAPTNMSIAVIPLGYCNGYPRGLSNRGHVLIHGKKAQIVGLVNMNLFMVNISHIPNVQIGDEVVLLGKQRNSVINVSSFTNFTDLVNNEMISRLPDAIPRTIVR